MAESSQNTQNDQENGPIDIKPTLEQPTDTPKTNGADHDTSDDSTERPADTPKTNGTTNGASEDGKNHHNDRDAARLDHSDQDQDAQAMVISSLRSQIQDLISQVSQLNTKLVKSYDRVSDLEDNLHVASSNVRTSSLKISQLELERMQHLSALNTGLLVEKSHVTAELTRLMEKATEEAAQRGQAETARRDIEKDLDDLSAELFGRANTMVAEERFARYKSEQKLGHAEGALKSAEEAVRVMQQQMQALQAEKEEAALAGKKLTQERWESVGKRTAMTTKLMSSHTPYQEFLLFIAHLRSIHPTSPQPPAMTTILPLPFLARLLNEDSEPTVRLDLAPSLNWLSRRSVLSAIHNGQLIIEPISSAALLPESSSSPVGSNNIVNVNCALCGSPVFPSSGANASISQAAATSSTTGISWSASLFKKPSHSTTNYSISSSSTSSQPSTPTRASHQRSWSSSSQVYIFRLAPQISTGGPSISIPLTRAVPSQHTPGADVGTNSSYTPNVATSSSTSSSSTIYPLCTSNWCLSRLRATCTLWAFVRTGIVEKVWEEEVPNVRLPPTPTPANANPNGSTAATSSTGGKPPPVPPRRRGLWGMASSAFGARAASWTEGDSKESKEKGKTTMTPPPSHPTQAEQKKLGGEQRRLPPPLPPSAAVKPLPTATTSGAANTNAKQPPPQQQQHSVPPPLPKRSQVRDHHQTPGGSPSPKEKTLSEIGQSAGAGTAVEGSLPQRPPRRPITPASVPLPESRPHTPPVVLNTSSGSGTTTNGGPAPPPLPRRAAARSTRPLVDGTASSLSRPSTPAAVTNPDPSPVVDEVKAGKEDDNKKNSENDDLEEKAREEAGAVEAPSTLPSYSDETSPSKDQETTKTNDAGEQQQQKTEQVTNDVGDHANDTSDPSSLSLDSSIPAVPSSASADEVASQDEGKKDTQSTEKETETETEKTNDGAAVPTSSSSLSLVDKEEDGEAFVDAETTLDPVVVVGDGNDAIEKHEKEADIGNSNDASAPAPSPSEEDARVDVAIEEQNKKTAATEASDPAVDQQASGDVEVVKDATNISQDEKVQGNEDKGVAVEATAAPSAKGVDGGNTEATAAEKRGTVEGEGIVRGVSAGDGGKAKPDDNGSNKEAYIGDATWEERTWKELVRLKEEMFWARIGGLRE